MNTLSRPLALASIAFALLAGGCDAPGSSAEPPANFKVVPGDASAIATWTAEPDVNYWIFYGPGDSITTSNWATSGGGAITNATSPRVIVGLVNGRTYSFTINGRKEGGPGGPGAPTQVVVPVLAGTNWAVGTPLGTAKLGGVAAGNTSAGYATVHVGAGGALYTAFYGGATSTPTNPTSPADLNAAWFGSGGFVAAGGGGKIMSSPDGVTWTAGNNASTATIRGGTVIIAGGHLAVGDAGTILASANGTDWSAVTSGSSANLRAISFGAGRYVAVGDGGTILSSTDGSNWSAAASGTTADLHGVAFVAIASVTDPTVFTNTWIAVGKGGAVITSSDATAWTPVAAFTTRDILGLVYGGQFVAVGAGGGIYTSTDGRTWQVRSSGTANDLTAVVRTLSGYTVVGDKGTVVSSY